MSLRAKKSLSYPALLVAALLVSASAQQVWTWTTPDISQWDEDEVEYHRLASKWAGFFEHPGLNTAGQAFWASGIRPPLGPMVFGAAMALFGGEPEVALSGQIVFLLVLVCCTYGLAKELYDKRTALLAAILVMGSPLVTVMAGSLMLDLPLAAVSMAVAWYSWNKSPWNTIRGTTCLGLLFGAGMLVKWTFPIFAGPVVMAALFRDLPAEKPRKQKVAIWIKLVTSTLVGVLLCSGWYIESWPDLSTWLLQISVGKEAGLYGATGRTQLQEASFYPVGLVNYGLTWPVFLLACWSAVLGFKAKVLKWNSVHWPPVLGLVIPVSLFSLILNKEMRYLVPVLPYLSMLAAALITKTLGRPLLLAATAAWCCTQLWAFTLTRECQPNIAKDLSVPPIHYSISECTGSIPTRIYVPTAAGDLELLTRSRIFYPTHFKVPPEQNVWIAAGIVHCMSKAAGRLNVVALSWETRLWTALWHLSRRRDLKFDVSSSACNPKSVSGADVVLALEPPTPLSICDQAAGFNAFHAIQDRFDLVVDEPVPPDRRLKLWVADRVLNAASRSCSGMEIRRNHRCSAWLERYVCTFRPR